MSATPQYEHDCDQCKFLGRFGNADLYWHPDSTAPYLSTAVVRFSSDGPDYTSGSNRTNRTPAIREAIRRAVEQGHLDARWIPS